MDREERETDDVGSLCFVSSKLSLEEAAAADRLFERRRRRNTPTDRPTAASDAANAAQTQRRAAVVAVVRRRLQLVHCLFSNKWETCAAAAASAKGPRERGRERHPVRDARGRAGRRAAPPRQREERTPTAASSVDSGGPLQTRRITPPH